MLLFIKKILAYPFIRNKYFLVVVSFSIWMIFFDQNSYLNKRKYNKELKQLKLDKEFYLKKIEEDSVQLNELKTNNLNLEKFARERYLMKRPNEDVFIMMDETTK